MWYVCGWSKGTRLACLVGITALFTFLSGCGSPVSKEYPAVVEIIQPEGAGYCSGTFISSRAILTAAHCTQEAGTYSIVSAFGTFQTSRVVNAANGATTVVNDISLLILEEDVADASRIMGIGDTVRVGDEVKIIGFGCNDVSTKRGAGVKRHGTNLVDHVDEFIQIVSLSGENSRKRTANRHIVGETGNAGACFGDSGGPAAVAAKTGQTLLMVGIASSISASGQNLVSRYVDLTNRESRAFLVEVNRTLGLKIPGI